MKFFIDAAHVIHFEETHKSGILAMKLMFAHVILSLFTIYQNILLQIAVLKIFLEEAKKCHQNLWKYKN